MRIWVAMLVALLLSACQIGDPSLMSVSYSAYEGRPVVVTKMRVNGQPLGLIPTVVLGKADTSARRFGSRNQLLDYPAGAAGKMELDMTWVELPSGAAYSTVVQVALSDLERSAETGIGFMPIFAPGGRLIIASDPPPKTGGNSATRDVLRTCARRTTAEDVNYAANPGELPALREAMAAALKTPAKSDCIQ